MQGKPIYEFGRFRLDPAERRLLHQGQPVSLSPQLFSLLVVFVENSGKLISKEALRNKVWGNAYVSEDALKVIIGNLRKAIGENGERYIETVRGGGYRFMAPVTIIEEVKQDLIEADREPASFDSSNISATSANTAAASSTPAPKIRSLWVKTVGACMIAALVVASGLYWSRVREKDRLRVPTKDQLVEQQARPSVAVVGFRNLSAMPGKMWLSTAFSEMLSTELAAGKGSRVVPPDRVARAKRELTINDNENLSPETLERIHKNLSADFIVAGSYTVVGRGENSQIRLDVRVQNTRTGETVVWKSIVGKEKYLFGFVSEAGRVLRTSLGLTELPPEQANTIKTLFPSNPQAAEIYSEGLEKLRSSNFLEARNLFQRALALEPRHPLIHSALAAALSNLGYEVLARREGESAVSLASTLPLEQRLSVEGQYRQSTKEWDKAIDVYRTLFNYVPDRLEYGLQLANTQTSAGKGVDALITLDALRKNPVFQDDGRVDLAQASAKLALGDFKASDEASQRAIAKGNAAGARTLVAEAFSIKASADRYSRLNDAAISASEQAEHIYEQLGDRAGMARALVLRAGALRDNGPVATRKKMYEDAIAVFEQIGNKSDKARTLNALAGVYEDLGDMQTTIVMYEAALRLRNEIDDKAGTAVCLNNIGTVYGIQGDLQRAKQKYEEALASFKKLDHKQGIVLATGNIAGILERQGALTQSKEQNEQALALSRELDAKDNIASHLENIGNIQLAQGDVSGALTLLRQALAESKTGHNKLLQAGILNSLGKALAAQANFAEAEEAHAEAAALISQVGGKLSHAANQLGTAELMIVENHYDQAEIMAREVVKEFEKQRERDGLLEAREVLARSLLGTKQCTAASEEIGRALTLARQSQNPRLQASVAITESRIQGACDPGSSSKAKVRLLSAMRDSQARGFVALALESKLALVELEARTGFSNTSDSMVASLIQEASARGFALIVNHAKGLQPRPLSGSN
ncbi:MAG: tetratricopeptide repeat protein [Acidobacteriia bacterium]|nr:tetratricopeptide repeat protein [Terriglobia bacterium]